MPSIDPSPVPGLSFLLAADVGSAPVRRSFVDGARTGASWPHWHCGRGSIVVAAAGIGYSCRRDRGVTFVSLRGSSHDGGSDTRAAITRTPGVSRRERRGRGAGGTAAGPCFGTGAPSRRGESGGEFREVGDSRAVSRAGRRGSQSPDDQNDVKNRAAIHTAVDRGMTELTGATDAVEAWRSFFEPGDVVGVKMNPVGNPLANSSSELMLEVIDGLKAAGVKTKDIVVFERYRDEFIDAKMQKAVPEGIAWTGLGIAYNGQQIDINGDDLKSGNLDRVTGYDPDEFMVMELVDGRPRPQGRPDQALASGPARHAPRQQARAVARIEGPRLGRGHRRAQEHEPWIGQQRVPFARHARHQRLQPVHPAGRQPPGDPSEVRVADHGRDQGRVPGGPGASRPEWTWENNALLFATDPVAMDHVAWRQVDAKRAEKKLPPVGALPASSASTRSIAKASISASPSTFALAAHLGLGIFDFDSPRGKRTRSGTGSSS